VSLSSYPNPILLLFYYVGPNLPLNQITNALKRSNPDDYKRQFKAARLFVFTINKIPRGRAKAPQIVRPKNDSDLAEITKHLSISKEKLTVLKELKPGNYFEHPFFGNLKLKPAVKFLVIHTKHHLEIINDIIKAESI
jgi:hypothetical protein